MCCPHILGQFKGATGFFCVQYSEAETYIPRQNGPTENCFFYFTAARRISSQVRMEKSPVSRVQVSAILGREP